MNFTGMFALGLLLNATTVFAAEPIKGFVEYNFGMSFADVDKKLTCQRQSKSEPKGSAKCCHFGVGIISLQMSASIRAAALVI